jgi:pimeloyl-ACP methyl ester carboxylesterase
MLGKKGWGALALVGLVVAACSSDAKPQSGASSAGVSASSSPAVTAPPFTPTYVTGPCNDEVPTDPRVECGVLTVAVDRSAPDGAKAELPVAIIHPPAGVEKQPDPVVYFSGGPGFPGLTNASGFLNHPDVTDRDMILFDQRGTGKATPNLDCPDVYEHAFTALGAAAEPAAEADAAIDVLKRCRDALVAQGIDLTKFSTPITADDVADLKLALGIDTWNLFGVSYGTAVALEVLRRHPEGVRSAVIDSVVPTDAPGDAQKRAEVTHRAIDTLAAGCAADPACHRDVPDVAAELTHLMDDWNATPFETDVQDRNGATRHLVLTGYDAVAGIWNAMYDTTLIPLLPMVIHRLPDRDAFAATVAQQLAGDGLDQLTGAAEGDTISVDCADKQRLQRATEAEVLARDPMMTSFFTLSPERCDLWDVPSVDASFNEPVHSDVPTLVLAGEYDPITPPADGRHVADGLAHATFVQFPGLGHGTVFSGAPCPVNVFQSFIADPASPFTTCVDTMGPPKWAPLGQNPGG